MVLISLLYPMPWLNEVYITNNFRDPDGNIHPLPFKLNHLLVIMAMLVSGVQIALLIVKNSVYNSPRAKRICRIYELDHHELYVNKSLFKDMPMLIFTVVFGSTMLFFTFAFRVAEAGVPAYPSLSNHFLYY